MIDRRDVIWEGLKEVLWAPVTWVPFVPSMGLVALCPLPWWGDCIALGASALFVAGNWALFWPRLLKVVEGRLVLARSRSDQEAFGQLLKQLASKRLTHEASILALAEEILGKISTFNASQASDQSLRIENVARKVLDQMCAEARAALKENDDGERSARLEVSLKTLQDSQQMVERQAQLMEKIANRDPEDRLAELQDQLQSENTIAENVLNRLENDTQKTP